MTKRRAMTAARKRKICRAWGWRTPAPANQVIALENGKPVTLCDGAIIEFDHGRQLALSDDDSDENVRPMAGGDHKVKTRQDARERALKRQAGKSKTVGKKYKWPSRHFDKRYRKRMNGDVVER